MVHEQLRYIQNFTPLRCNDFNKNLVPVELAFQKLLHNVGSFNVNLYKSLPADQNFLSEKFVTLFYLVFLDF